MKPSQAVNNPAKNVWVCAKNTGEVITAGCTCMAGQARVCSHVGAVLWKVDLAVARGMTGLSCTDSEAQWNKGTKRNVEPGRLSEITFKLGKRTVDEPTQASQLRPLKTVMDAAQLKSLHENSPYPGLFQVPGMFSHQMLCLCKTIILFNRSNLKEASPECIAHFILHNIQENNEIRSHRPTEA